MTPGPDSDAQPFLDRDGLAGDFADLARALQAEGTVQRTLEVMCKLAVDAITAAEHAGITVIRSGRFETPAASDGIPPMVDRIQYETGEGPCVDAIRTHEVLLLDDITAAGRWPAFTARMVAETEVRSMLSYRLFVQADTLGALNLYSSQPKAFDDADRPMGAVFAAHASVAMQAALERDRNANLTEALESNRRIGIATGIIMVRKMVREDEAFERLRMASQNANRKLRLVADDVILTGELPTAHVQNGRPGGHDPG